MLQDSIGSNRLSGYYAQGFGNPGNVGVPPNGIQGGMTGQPQQGRGRPRATSNIGMQGSQSQASGISQWQNNVQASHATPPTVVDQRSHQGYVNANPQQAQYVVADGPHDPGPPPSVKGQGLSKQEKKAILDDWQQKADKFEAYKASLQREGHKRSKSQSRYNDGQYVTNGGTLAFPQTQSGYGSQPSSDIERAMRSLTLKPHGNDAAAQRQAERGRRLSGGVLGLTGSAAQQAQQEQERRMRERSRSRQPYEIDETMGGIRPAYMPQGRANIANIGNVDSGLINVGQPAVHPTSNSQYVNPGARQEMGHVPVGQYVVAQGPGQQPVQYAYQTGAQQPQVSPAMFAQQLPYQNPGQQPQVSPAMYGQPLPYQNVGQQPQVSPAMYGQPLPPQNQYVPVTVGGVTTMAIPVGPVSQFPAFAQGQPSVSPMHSPIDGQNMAQYLTPAFINQPMPPAEQAPRRKTNIANVINPQQQQQQQQYQQYVSNPYVNPKTILTPGPPPKQLHTSNINNINNTTMQPAVQARNRALSQSGYVTGAPQGNSQPPVVPGNRPSAYVSASGGVEHAASMLPSRPSMPHSDTLQTTGPQGFGSRPAHTRAPSYKATINPTSQGSRADSDPPRSGVPVVSMRRPRPDMHPQRFSPKVISYDLNGEHRQDVPLRFGKFIYERDCNHEEWNLFTQQILEIWAERNPAYNYYHSAVKRIDAILSAWNYAFFHPRGLDVVLFKGNERRSGPRFGEPEANIDFLTEASPVSDGEEESSEESDEDEDNPVNILASQNPQYRAQVEREKQARRAYRAEEKRREAAAKPLEAPHSLVIYEIPMVTGNESYR